MKQFGRAWRICIWPQQYFTAADHDTPIRNDAQVCSLSQIQQHAIIILVCPSFKPSASRPLVLNILGPTIDGLDRCMSWMMISIWCDLVMQATSGEERLHHMQTLKDWPIQAPPSIWNPFNPHQSCLSVV